MPEKIELIDGKLFGTEGDRLRMLGLLLENVGLLPAVRLAPLERWREALAPVGAGERQRQERAVGSPLRRRSQRGAPVWG